MSQGRPITPVAIYSRKALILAMQRYNKEHGKPPTVHDCNKANDMPSYSTYFAHFGSFNAAILAAGFVPEEHSGRGKKHYTESDLLKKLHQFIVALGFIPTPLEYRSGRTKAFPKLDTYIYRFGSFEVALKKCGVKFNHMYFIIRCAMKHLHRFADWTSNHFKERIEQNKIASRS